MIPVLYYHRIGPFAPGEERRMNVEPGRFRDQMRRLREKHEPVSLDAVLAGAPAGSVSVTFDDGYRDLVEYALPVLKEFRIPATLFIVAGAVGGKDRWYRGERDVMTWDEIKAAADAGFEIGSHSMTHPRLDELAPADRALEIGESKRILEERLSIRVRHFAYPQGRHSEEIKRAVAAAGYVSAWATRSGEGGAYAMKRLRVASDESLFRFGWKLRKARWGWY